MLRVIAVTLGTASLLAGCAALQPGRSVGRSIDDFNASTQIKSTMLRAEGYALNGVDLEVTEGVALLSGRVPRPEDKVYAECVTWASPGVRDVVNEVVVGTSQGAGAVARDAWITQQIRARLVSDADVRAVNMNIETQNGTVYLLGFARSEGERDRASRHASLVDGVEQVVVLMRVPGEAPELGPRGARRAELCDLDPTG